ncbi:hypothetical protein ACTXJX_17430 [Glutamicibacter ardleyensis]|uniref:hypothetical protein n=1 Tax=Glutamicibacter ardleyensis TaxID=225894 RepID=UPI003FD606D3
MDASEIDSALERAMNRSASFNITLIIITGLVAVGCVLWIAFSLVAPIIECHQAQGLYTGNLLSGHCDN